MACQLGVGGCHRASYCRVDGLDEQTCGQTSAETLLLR